MKLARKFSLWSVPTFLVVAALLIGLNRQFVQEDVRSLAAEQSIPVAQTLGNALWPYFRELLSTPRSDTGSLDRVVAGYLEDTANVKVRIHDPRRQVVYSSVADEVGSPSPDSDAIRSGLKGKVTTSLTRHERLRGPDGALDERYIATTWMPILSAGDGKVAAILELDRDVSPLVHRMGTHPFRLATVVLASLAVLFAIQFMFVTSADRAISLEATRRQEVEEQLQFDALHDALTGLPNRSLFLDRLQHLIDTSRRDSARRFAVFFLDLDRFKVINDSLGHVAGDQLLVEAARRIDANVRPGDTVARLGGDEFAVLLESVTDTNDGIHVAERILAAFRDSFNIGEREVISTTSIGIMFCNDPMLETQEILRNADIAMYHAKANGKARYTVFGKEMHVEAMKRVELEADLRIALKHEQMRVCFQPIMDLQHDRVVSFEALLRWEHPVRGRLAPDAFLPIAEEAGLIRELDEWVLVQSCRALAGWRREIPGCEDLTVTVNLSGLDFADRRWGLIVLDILEREGIAGKHLKLELTESAFLNNTVIVKDLFSNLRSSGVQLCMDDFGTGFSSLSYISRHRFDMLKIDHSFISEMLEIEQSQQIVRTIIDMGKILGVSVTAEGIETEAQYTILRDLGCPFGQGYWLSKPIDLADVNSFLDQRTEIGKAS